MKKFITLLLICFSITAFSQTEKKVEKNDEKISELNKRLDNLLGSSKSISGDSVEYKLDLLFKEIESLKKEMNTLTKSVKDLKENGFSGSSKAGLNELNAKIRDIEDGEYYVVLASEKSKARIDIMLERLSKKHSVTAVANAKGTWFHVILSQSLNMRSAIQSTNDIKKDDVKDAWWVTGKKLKVL